MKRRMGPTHHLLPNVRFTELRSSEGKSTVRIDRKLLIKLKAHLRVCLFLYMASYPPRGPGKQGSRRWRSETTTDSLHRLVRSVRWICSAAT